MSDKMHGACTSYQMHQPGGQVSITIMPAFPLLVAPSPLLPLGLEGMCVCVCVCVRACVRACVRVFLNQAETLQARSCLFSILAKLWSAATLPDSKVEGLNPPSNLPSYRSPSPGGRP